MGIFERDIGIGPGVLSIWRVRDAVGTAYEVRYDGKPLLTDNDPNRPVRYLSLARAGEDLASGLLDDLLGFSIKGKLDPDPRKWRQYGL